MQDAPGDGEAEACAALPAFGRDQRLEDPADKLRWNPLAVVFDPNLDPLSTFLTGDPDVAMLADRVASVQENIGQNLLQVMKVPAHLGFRDGVDMDRNLFRLEKVFVKTHR
jgi:hypothetical protein